MMKKVLITIVFCILILFEGFLIYKKTDKVLVKINDNTITYRALKAFQYDQNKFYNVDLMESTVLLDYIKYQIFRQLCDSFNISLLSINKNTLLEDGKYKNFKDNIVNPIIYKESFYNYIDNDTILFQRNPYIKAKNIEKKWIEEEKWESLVEGNEIEFFRKHISIDELNLLENNIGKDSNNNYYFSGDGYFYVVKILDNTMIGFRIEKISPDTILKNITKKIKIVFYSDEMYRSIEKISKGTIWHSIIFQKTENKKE